MEALARREAGPGAGADISWIYKVSHPTISRLRPEGTPAELTQL